MHASSSWIAVVTSFATASVITWAFADTAELEPQSLDGVYIKSFVHASTAIWLGLLKHVLPQFAENQTTVIDRCWQNHASDIYILCAPSKTLLDTWLWTLTSKEHL